MNDVTKMLQPLEDGDPTAAEKLLPLAYQELRKLAADNDWAYATAWWRLDMAETD